MLCDIDLSFIIALLQFTCSVHDTCDIGNLVGDKCHPPSKEHESWLVDPLKFKMDLPAHEDITYIAVISMKPDFTFVLHEVYQMQDKALNPAFNVVQPRRYTKIAIIINILLQYSYITECLFFML